VSRKAVTIGKEVFDFLAWKKPNHSFYGRRSDGEVSVVALIGSRLPLWATRFRCEFPDGTTIGFNRYQLSPMSLSQMAQLERLFPELQKDKPAGGGGKTPPALRAKRSNAGKRKARVQDPDDILKIKKAFAARTVGGGLTNNAVARELAELVSEDHKALDLSVPYYNISPDAIRRLVGVKK
jgi:hypothetical protein